MKNLLIRLLTGIVIVLTIIGALVGGAYTFAGLFLLILFAGLSEFYKLIQNKMSLSIKIGTMLSGGLIFGICFLHAASISWYPILIILLILSIIYIFINSLYTKQDNPFANVSILFLGLIYITLPLSMANYIVFNDIFGEQYNYHFILSFFILIWLNDTGAYLFGTAFGKHRLFERISPKKSWEGSAGGALVALCSAWIISIFYTELNLWQWFGYALVVVVGGTYGDLIESMLKRSLNIKDSGNILPGHGGVLDRFDSVFIALPALYCYLNLLEIIN